MTKIQLGDNVKDTVTGFKGVVTAIIQYLTGCDQASVCPKLDKEGMPQDAYNFDVTRLEITKKKAVVIGQTKKQRTSGADFNATSLKHMR